MRFEMKVPDLATTDSGLRIIRWLVELGQEVKRGRAIVEVETDKAAMEVESVVSGTLLEICAKVDDEVLVGDVIAVLEVADAPKSAQTSAPTDASSSTAPKPPCSQDRVSMFARNKAKTTLTVPGIPLSVAQRTAGKRLQESKQTIPHFYLQTSVNATKIVAKREATKEVRLAWDAFFVRAAALAMRRYDRFRCRLEGDRLVLLQTDAIGVAIDHEGELYVIPILEPAEKPIETISEEIRNNLSRLRSGDPEARMIRPAAITISNLGMCHVECLIPVINPPETAILGIGKIALTPVALEDGRVGVEPRCTLTLSVDHRVVCGRYAADFLTAIVREVEST